MTKPESDTSTAQSQRFKPIPLENLTAEQRVLADAVRSGPRGAVKNSAAAKPGPLGGPFNVFLRSPDIGNIIQSLGAAIRFRSSLPPKLNELAIIVTARQWTSRVAGPSPPRAGGRPRPGHWRRHRAGPPAGEDVGGRSDRI